MLTVDGFDGSLFRIIDDYRANLLDAARILELSVAQSSAIGDLLPGDLLAEGRSIVQSINVRNQEPLFSPIYLTYLQHPEWLRRTDSVLVRLKAALRSTPSRYKEAVKHARAEAVGGLFELNVYDVLDRAFPGATPYPPIPGTVRRSDVKIVVGAQPVYVEATALTEGEYWDGVANFMREAGLSVYATSGPGPSAEARRIVLKIAGELEQTAADVPNVLCISFFGSSPSSFAIDQAFVDLMNGAPAFGTGKEGILADLSNLSRVDSVLEFSRSRFRRTHVNPSTLPSCRLPDDAREALVKAFSEAGDLMIR